MSSEDLFAEFSGVVIPEQTCAYLDWCVDRRWGGCMTRITDRLLVQRVDDNLLVIIDEGSGAEILLSGPRGCSCP